MDTPIVIIIALIMITLLLSNKIEGYDSKYDTIASYSPVDSQPYRMFDYWYYYSPYRFRMGYNRFPRYGIMPLLYRPQPYFYNF